MVTAGVYLLVRMSPVLTLSPDGRLTIAFIGAITAFVAATIATSQQDIKKVLAFSTVSQIGYMVLAVGVGAYSAAIFLMIAHAFYKALLFLGAGSVIHSLNGEQDMRKTGGLAKYLPITFPAFTVAWLAIIGIPPFSGFFAKGDVLTNAFEHNKFLWAIGVVTAILTAYYMTRLFVLTFRGQERFRELTSGHDPHESPWPMTVPLIVLSVLAILGGVINLPWAHGATLSHFLSPVLGFVPAVATAGTGAQWALALVDVAAAVIGLTAAFAIWRDTSDSKRWVSPFLEHVWYWDNFYDAIIGRPLIRAAKFSDDVVEPDVIDGAVTGVAVGIRDSAEGLRKIQSGFVRQYALAMVLGFAVIIVYLLARVH
jgi:NADH-quinone oxidoreductase subunit L